MISRFFIDRPIFANVIAIVTVVFGLVTARGLPVEQYPDITPPTVQVSTTYPGANAQVVSDTVAAPIEEQVNGVEGMLYMSSVSAADGSYNLTVTFDIGVDLDIAQVLWQNRVAIAQPLLPVHVQRQGVTTKKQSTSIILFVALTSPDDRYDSLYLSNYATLRVRDELSRRGRRRRRERLRRRQLQHAGVARPPPAEGAQPDHGRRDRGHPGAKRSGPAGQLGQPPAPDSQTYQLTVTTLGRLSDVSQFENIIVKTDGIRVSVCATWPRSSWVGRTTRSSSRRTRSRPPASPCTSSRARTRSTLRRRCGR